ncbi:MAG: hypothetical protein Q8L66_00325 [Caulobacter sp.]|nr:hypothetical protein [Caulobacter sp.]
MAPRNLLLALAGGMLVWLASSVVPGDQASAQCCAPPPPPPCCTPPAPPPCCTPPAPPPRPPSPPGCCAPGGRTNIIVNSNAVAVAISGAGAGAGAVAYGGGGGGGYYSPPVATGLIQGLDVEGMRKMRKVAYEASRSRTRRVVIQAFCLDDRDVPHPASQVFADRDVDDLYDGELYRCIAGSRLQVIVADFAEQISFNGGVTTLCAKGEALYRARGADGGQLVCRPQKPARDCNERSLLRRFGAGIKVLTIVTIETYTAYREEEVTESSASSFSMSLDGGVGGTVY